MPRRLAALGLVALLVAVAVVSYSRRPRAGAGSELLPYQARASQLPAAEQQRLAQLRLALREAEQVRGKSGRWPDSFSAPGLSWVHRADGLYVNYLGIPAEPDRLRWLVLVIEPAPAALADPAPPEDEEHHTLSDGTALHVTLWSAPNHGPVPGKVLSFPAAEHWIQWLGPP